MSGGGFLLSATDAGSVGLHAVPRPQCVGPPPRLMTSFQLFWNVVPTGNAMSREEAAADRALRRSTGFPIN